MIAITNTTILVSSALILTILLFIIIGSFCLGKDYQKKAQEKEAAKKNLPSKPADGLGRHPTLHTYLNQLPNGSKISMTHVAKVDKISYFIIKLFRDAEYILSIQLVTHADGLQDAREYEAGSYVLKRDKSGLYLLESWERRLEKITASKSRRPGRDS